MAARLPRDFRYSTACFNCLYETEYVLEHQGLSDHRALSCSFPVNYDAARREGWPPFILDIMPAGAARKGCLEDLGLERDGQIQDWAVLLRGACNPPGNIRVLEAAAFLQPENHPGFEKEEVITREKDFIAYARDKGAPVAGTSGAHGEQPKLLLTQDAAGKWHPDGALTDDRARRHWLVKFPRSGKRKLDLKILRNEAAYLAVAKNAGLRALEGAECIEGALFVPRFDRVAMVAESNVMEWSLWHRWLG